MITVNWMILCDFASVSIENKANLLGIFDELKCKKMPLDIPQMFIVIDTFVESGTNGYIETVIIKDDNGSILFKSAPSHIAASCGHGKKPLGIPVQVNNLVFPEFGKYRVEFKFNDKVIHTKYLSLIQ